jgi:hypothetical protein
MEIKAWLQNIGLEQYADRFQENNIDVSVLPTLTDEDLKELGIESLGHRKAIIAATQEKADKGISPALKGMLLGCLSSGGVGLILATYKEAQGLATSHFIWFMIFGFMGALIGAIIGGFTEMRRNSK